MHKIRQNKSRPQFLGASWNCCGDEYLKLDVNGNHIIILDDS